MKNGASVQSDFKMNYQLFTIFFLIFSTCSAQKLFPDEAPGPLIENKKAFWKQIYADIDSSRTVIFDKYTLYIYAIIKNTEVDDAVDSIKIRSQNPNRIMIKQGRKEFVHEAILRASEYRFVIDSLNAHGLDPDLQWLPVLESGYIDTMISDQNARGIWQFIPPTAKKFGLSVEEIADSHKSTSAFVQYISSLYRQFGDYALALTAYHHGEGGIREKLKKNSAVSLNDIVPYLGFQSGNYYARYLSIVDIAKTLSAGNDTVGK
jgi:hypothetical protein